MKKSAWGIDLGTTNSCIARASASGAEVVRIDEGLTVPSVLAWNGHELLVGRRAANHAVLAPDQAVRSIKRRMGDAEYRVLLGDTEFSPIDVSARIVGYLKTQAEAVTGERVEEAVITVPAWFNESQRRATVAAGERAGLEVTRIINEPTAAGLAYGHTGASRSIAPPDGSTERWLVYDLGGGTFDVSILAVAGDYKEVLASSGNTYLGGDDFDHRIVLHWVDHLRDRHNVDVARDRLAMAQLRHLAEQAKIRLSDEVEVPVSAFIEAEGKRLELGEVLTRAQFAAMIDDYLESTLAKARQALEEARVSAPELSRALLVGGSTRIPRVHERVAQEFGIAPDAYIEVELSVALGAALQSALDHALSAAQIVVDIAPHSLGVAALGPEDEASMQPVLLSALDPEEAEEEEDPISYPKTFVPVIRKNARLPARFVEEFYTVYDGQDGVDVVVLQGESSNTRENTLVGAFHVLIDPKPAGTGVWVGFEYDRSGLVRVSLSDQGGTKVHKSHTLDLTRSADSNSDSYVLRGLTRSGNRGPELPELEDDIEETLSPPTQVSNFLIEQVDRRLASRPPTEEVEIRAALSTYRELLAEGRDAGIDEVEDRLFGWLDGVESSGPLPEADA
ncbi:MAG: Hsp70 family protein [Gemmatimonas sp.]|nr:Hsp70 family protein [Gemmatimonas sp.]